MRRSGGEASLSARSPRAARRPSRIGILALLGAVFFLASCLGPSPRRWGGSVTDLELEQAMVGLPVEAREALLPLSEIFYTRIISRRFNSRATFEDPSMRQFFPTVAAYSDYYAALADALDAANIEFNRPARVVLLSIDRNPSGSLSLEVRFVGENDLPLRWWNAALVRRDEWQWQDDRWWVVPGKV